MARPREARRVRDQAILIIVAACQAAFFTLLVLLVFVNRARRMRQARRAALAASHVAEPLQRWVLGTARAGEVADALRALPPPDALEQITLAVASRVAPGQLAELARAVREEPWVRRVLAQSSSRWWWRRLDAARLLAIVASMRDRALLRRLLDDPHPAVQAAATASLYRLGDSVLIEHVLDTLHTRCTVVRVFQLGVLRTAWKDAAPALLARLRPDAPVAKLEVWITLAESFGDPHCLGALLALRHHPLAQVRISTARALRGYFHADAEAALGELIADDDWRVRAQAARALGAIGAAGAVPDLVRALADRSWWVRFRAALALAQLKEPGRRALRDARALPDRYAADMAAMVSGLSDGAVVELAEA
ncbi:MAG TPA: HEAT repeat domain-containing protein [Gemmatimonadaceae bacterium]|nr:HEAT repeat domain-containing protein [Gemmatimonadaceae bacterium]